MTDAAQSSDREPRPYVVRHPSKEESTRAGRRLYDVLLLAEALPVRHTRELRFPPAHLFLQARR